MQFRARSRRLSGPRCGSAACSLPGLLLVASVVGCDGRAPVSPSDAGEQAGAARSGPVETIVYTTLRPGNFDLFLLEEGDAEPRALTRDPAKDYNATFSPDGRWVVFTSERAGGADLYAIDLQAAGDSDGAAALQPVRLTSHRALDDAADFAPDGERLAFVSTRDGDADIFVMPFAPGDPTAEERAVNLTRSPGGDFQPAFSPDGRRIAYSRQVELWSRISLDDPRFVSAEAALHVMNADGSDSRRLSEPGPGYSLEGVEFGRVAGSPAWSGDGKALIYHLVGPDDTQIRWMEADGAGDRLLAQGGLSPAVGREGRIVFSRPQPREGLDRFDVLKTGRIVSLHPAEGEGGGEAGAVVLGDEGRAAFAPDVDPVAGRIVYHATAAVRGPGTESASAFERVGAGYVFAPPGARSRVELPDRTVELIGVRGYFPALLPGGEVVSTPLHRGGSSLPVEATTLDGRSPRVLFAPERGMAWGAATAAVAGRVFFAVGPPFAPAEAGVDIWSVGIDGSSPTNLTAGVSANDALPHVTPDGGRVVFRRGGDGGGSLHAMNGDGGGQERLGSATAVETMPAFSPDGEWIVFTTRLDGSYKLKIARADGSEPRLLEPDRAELADQSLHPRFSPDGRWVVFTSDRGGFNDEWPLTWFPQPYGDLWALPVDGGPAVRLTHDKWEDGPSDWGFVPAETLP